MVLPVFAYGHPLLRKVCSDITPEYPDLEKLIQDMWDTTYYTNGVGLAAPQVGIGKRIMVTDPSAGEKRNQLITIFNPEIADSEGEQLEEEGCLSIPGFSAVVLRPKKVILKGMDLNGKEITVEGKDLLARAFCHEMDHLNGVFFLDHLSFLKRDLIKRKIRKLVKQGEWES